MITFESSLLNSIPGIVHGFGTAAHPIPEALASSWDSLKPQWKQVHGTAVARVTAAGDACGEVDALWSEASRALIGVVTADCVPLLIASRDGRAVAAIHAGWRGTLAMITRHVVRELSRAGHSPDTLVAAIGPCIQSCCFEVGEDVVEKFVMEFPQLSEDELSPQFRHLDLTAVNAALLRGMGVEEIDILPHCTKCSRLPSGEFTFNSYRRQGGGTRQWSLIGRGLET